MDLMQILGILIASTAFILFLTYLVSIARKQLMASFLPVFSCLICVLLGTFLAVYGNPDGRGLELVAQWNFAATAMVYVQGTGLLTITRGDSRIFKDREEYFDTGNLGIVALSADRTGKLYILNVLNEIATVQTLKKNIVESIYTVPSKTVYGITASNETFYISNGTHIWMHENDICIALNVTNITQPMALAYSKFLYVADQNRVLGIVGNKIVRNIGPTGPGRRMAIWNDRFLILVQTGRVSFFSLETGRLFTVLNLPNILDISVSNHNVYLCDGKKIFIYALN